MRTIPAGPEGAAMAPALKTLSARITLAVGVLLALVKLTGWLVTGSMALMA